MAQCYGIQLEFHAQSQGVVFPCKKRWLRGEEYGFLIRHYYAYAKILELHPFYDKDHPARETYEQPSRK